MKHTKHDLINVGKIVVTNVTYMVKHNKQKTWFTPFSKEYKLLSQKKSFLILSIISDEDVDDISRYVTNDGILLIQPNVEVTIISA